MGGERLSLLPSSLPLLSLLLPNPLAVGGADWGSLDCVVGVGETLSP